MNWKISYHELHAALLRRVFRHPSTYAALCERRWTIAPAESRIEPRAVYLGDELERVRGVQEDTNMEAEIRRVEGGPREHAATIGYRLTDVRLTSGHLVKGAMSHAISQSSGHVAAAEQVELSTAAVGSTLMGSIYFGHWMRDDATLRLAVQDLAPTIDIEHQPYSHAAGYRELLSLPERVVAKGRFRELILLDDWGQNAYKRRRYQALRSTFRRSIAGAGNERIYLKRGAANGVRGRNLLNAPDVEAALVAQGFSVVDPDTMAADQIARLATDAKIIVGVEGSHLAHAIYPIADGGTLVVLQPPMRFNNVYKDLSDAVGLRYAFTVGDPGDGGFSIDVNRLNRLLDRLAA